MFSDIQLFRERLLTKVHTTILKGIQVRSLGLRRGVRTDTNIS